MKLERSKNASRNIIFGSLLNIYSMMLPFVSRTVLIKVLGMEYVGLNSLFTSVLSVLNLAELGVGSAMVFSMYKPIAEDNKEKICALMRLYRTYYRIIGCVILVVGLALLPFIDKLVKGGKLPDDLNIYVLYLIHLLSTVVTYMLFAYKNSILTAHQRLDIGKKVSIVLLTIQYALQVGLLLVTKNYYLYIIVILVIGIANNIIIAFFSDKLYPEFKPRGTIPVEEKKAINKRIRDLFTSKIGGVIVDQSDTIVISSFIGLSILGVYQNYYFILTSIYAFIKIILSSCTAGIGNSLVTESSEKNFNDLKRLTFLMSATAGFCACCLGCLYQPFISLWVGEENTLDYSFVILFCIYIYVRTINQMLITFKDAAGIWHEDRFRPLVVGLANLALNLILVQVIGLYGIILSTVLSWVVIGFPWLCHNVFTVLFKGRAKEFIVVLLKCLFVNLISFALCFGISYVISINSLILTIIVRLIICIFGVCCLYYMFFRRTDEFKGSVMIIDGLTKHRIAFLIKLC